VFINPWSKINGPNVKPLSLNQIMSNFSDLPERSDDPADHPLDHLFSRFSFDEMHLSPLSSPMAPHVSTKWRYFSPESTRLHSLSHPFTHSPPSLSLYNEEQGWTRERKKRYIREGRDIYELPICPPLSDIKDISFSFTRGIRWKNFMGLFGLPVASMPDQAIRPRFWMSNGKMLA